MRRVDGGLDGVVLLQDPEDGELGAATRRSSGGAPRGQRREEARWCGGGAGERRCGHVAVRVAAAATRPERDTEQRDGAGAREVAAATRPARDAESEGSIMLANPVAWCYTVLLSLHSLF